MVSKILLGNIFLLLLRWLPQAAPLWVSDCSVVFKCGPFFWWCSICIMLSTEPKECACPFLSVVQIRKCDYYSRRHVCVHCTFQLSFTCLSNVCFITVQTSLLWMRICCGYGYCMLGGCEWYCLCGKLFLYLNVWICSSSAYVSKCGPFVGRFWWNVYVVLYTICRFLWVDWERVIVKDIVYSVLFVAIFLIM